jgi:hypothetical protein
MHSDLNKDELYKLKEELFFVIDEKQHQADLTEIGRTKLRPDDPDAFMLPDLATDLHRHRQGRRQARRGAASRPKRAAQQRYAEVSEDIHAISQLLARLLRSTSATSSTSYQDGKVIIVDENTGRVMPGRRWSDGLHQAVEAKEDVDDRARDADLRDDHDPELLPHVREARGHDRHRRDRGARSSTTSTASSVHVIPTNTALHPASIATTPSSRPAATSSTPW